MTRSFRWKTALHTIWAAALFSGSSDILQAQGNITTYAGGGGQFTGDGKPAINAQFAGPTDVAVDPKGNVYFACPPMNMIMQIATDGTLHVIAGNGINATAGDGGPARAASLRAPNGVKLDGAGNILIADSQSQEVRVVDANGVIRKIAGGGGSGFGFSGDGVPAVSSFVNPLSAVADAKGNIFIADQYDNRVRMVDAAGVISTVAGNGQAGSAGDGGPANAASLNSPAGLAIDSAGRIYVSEQNGNRVRQFTVGGNITTVAGTGQRGFSGDGGPGNQAQLSQPTGLGLDSSGLLYIADTGNKRIRRVAPGGAITSIAGTGQSAFTGDGGPAVTASLGAPMGVAVAADGTVYIGDKENDRIRRIAPNGTISTIAGIGAYLGDGPVSTAARVPTPFELAIDPAGNLFVLTGDSRIRKVTPDGTVSTAVGTGRAGSSGNGGPAVNASLGAPNGIAVDAAGNLYVEDGSIRKVSTDGTISSFASIGGSSMTVDSAGNLFLSTGIAVSKVTPSGQISAFAGTGQSGFSGDGGPATSATFSFQIRGLAVGSDGSVYISDYGNNRVRRVDPSGIISTFAGNGKSQISGDGGPAAAAGLQAPRGLAMDSKGNLYIAQDGNIVRKVAPDGTISSYAGTSRYGLSGDGGIATSAGLAFPQGIALDKSGNLYIADSSNDRVRVVQAGAGPFLLLSQKGLTFKTGTSPATQSLTVVNSGQGTVNWAVSTSVASGGTNWLSATPATGSSLTGQSGPMVTVKADPTGLAPGDYYGQVVVSAPGVPNSPQSVTVVLSVPAPGTSSGSSVQPSGLLFTGVTGSTDPAPQSLTLSTTTTGGSKFGSSVVFGDGRAWFTYSPSSGSVQPNAPLTVQVKPALSGFTAGVYNAVLTFAFDDSTTQQINLLLVVSAGTGTAKPGSISAAGCAPGKLLPLFTSLGPGFSATAGWPAPVEVRVVDDCGNPLVKGSVTASFSNNDPALTLNPLLDGRWTGTWEVGNPGNVTVTAQASDAAGMLSGNAQVNGGLNANANPPPVVASGGVLDAASYFLGGPVAPGSLVAVFGQYLAASTSNATALPLPSTLGSTQVTIAGRSMPLLYAGANQVNAMIPYDLPINAAQQVVVKRGNTISIPQPVSLLSSKSGVFTKDLTGTGAGIVVKVAPDGTQSIVAAGNSVTANDAIVVYCDGLGNVTPQAIAGSETPVTPLSQTIDTVSMTIGGVKANVFFAGLTPGFTGLYQINAIVPSGVMPGDSVPLVIMQSGRGSPPVSISVR
jgi:uncharacterized protein (TIGR03437 family)